MEDGDIFNVGVGVEPTRGHGKCGSTGAPKSSKGRQKVVKRGTRFLLMVVVVVVAVAVAVATV